MSTTSVTALILAGVTFVSTLSGGLFALHQRRNLNLIMAFSAGVLVAAAFLDLLPEAFDLVEAKVGVSANGVLIAATIGYLAFYGLERFVHLTAAGHEGKERFGAVAALGLTTHSFLDGFAIGAAFRANPAIGAVVAVAVIAHDFADGVSTVVLVLGSRGTVRASFGWLLADALAPVVGAAVALLVAMSTGNLALTLGFFAGSFLFIGASHLLPESHQEHRELALPIAVVLGILFLFVVTQILSG